MGIKYETISAYRFSTITPSDTNVLPDSIRAIYIGGAGNLSVVNQDGTPVVFSGLVAGTILAIQTNKVMLTGTTATNLVALL